MEIHRSGWFVCFGFFAHAVKIINITSCVIRVKRLLDLFLSSLILIAFFSAMILVLFPLLLHI